METTINDMAAQETVAGPKRPQFLTVLCVLTWIWCAVLFLSTAWNIINKPSPEEQVEQIEKIREFNPAAADQMEALMDDQGNGQLISNILTLIGIALSAYGAFMMWQLKRTGFFLYLGGELLPYLNFVFAADAMGAGGAMLGLSASAFIGIMVGVFALFDAIFIAMYAANLKHMKA